LLPENADKRLEYIGGEMVEVLVPFSTAVISASIAAEIGTYVNDNHLGYLTGAQGGYQVSGERYLPNVAFSSKARPPKFPSETWVSFAPDLVVEMESLRRRVSEIADKVVNYLLAGTVVWYVCPDQVQVKVYEPGQPVKTLTINDTLDGGKVLPGFKVALKDIFPAED
jgi:Uma2 family endonuclease